MFSREWESFVELFDAGLSSYLCNQEIRLIIFIGEGEGEGEGEGVRVGVGEDLSFSPKPTASC